MNLRGTEMTKPRLTQSRLKELVRYDPETGVFIAKKRRSALMPGDEVGSAHNCGYRQAQIDCQMYLLHRLAFLYMTGDFPINHVDHINHNRSDNRWSNLRDATRTENQTNQKLRCDNTTGHYGVYYHKKRGHWTAQISNNGKHFHLGCFKTKSLAVEARKTAEIKYGYHPNHGVFA